LEKLGEIMGKYGKPISSDKMPKSKVKRLPQYDEALREFLASESDYYEVNLAAFPSQNVRVILSSLKWRVKNNADFKNVRVVMNKGKIFLEKVKGNSL
jgi:hypothetical protein